MDPENTAEPREADLRSEIAYAFDFTDEDMSAFKWVKGDEQAVIKNFKRKNPLRRFDTPATSEYALVKETDQAKATLYHHTIPGNPTDEIDVLFFETKDPLNDPHGMSYKLIRGRDENRAESLTVEICDKWGDGVLLNFSEGVLREVFEIRKANDKNDYRMLKPDDLIHYHQHIYQGVILPLIDGEEVDSTAMFREGVRRMHTSGPMILFKQFTGVQEPKIASPQ